MIFASEFQWKKQNLHCSCQAGYGSKTSFQTHFPIIELVFIVCLIELNWTNPFMVLALHVLVLILTIPIPHKALTSVLIFKSLAELAVFSCLDPKLGLAFRGCQCGTILLNLYGCTEHLLGPDNDI